MGNIHHFLSLMPEYFNQFFKYSAFANFTVGHLIMIVIGLLFIYFAIAKDYHPTLLITIGFGIIIGNIPFVEGMKIGVYEQGSVLSYINMGLTKAIFPSLLFLGLGAITDFSSIIANPRLMLIGLAAQIGIFSAYAMALILGFVPAHAGAIGIIGGVDGPTAIFLASKLAPDLMAAIAISVYTYYAFIPLIQPPIMKLLTTNKERLIKMKPPRQVSKREKILFPIIALLLTTLLVPAALPLLGMLFLGNLLKESTVTKQLADSAKGPLIDIVTILAGLAIGASTQANVFLNTRSIKIFIIGIVAFVIATIGGIIIVKVINLFLKNENKMNPLIGSAGVSAVPDSAKVSQLLGLKYDKTNHLLMHAMGPNVAGLIGSAIAAGVMLSFLH